MKALVLAAGNGGRFVNGTRHSKLLHSVLGEPLIVRTLNTARSAGITSFEIVLGYQAAQLDGVDINPTGDAYWFDIDTIGDLDAAETRLAAGSRPA